MVWVESWCPSLASRPSTSWSARSALPEDQSNVEANTSCNRDDHPHDGPHGPCLSARDDGNRGPHLPLSGEGQFDRARRQDHRFELIGQNFTSDAYFHGRPSATTDTDPNDPTKTIPAPYNAANSGASNYGPASQALVDRVKADAEALAATNPSTPVPIDLVTASASGLDPDMTPAAALFQVPRVAKARNLPEAEVKKLVSEKIHKRFLGLLGEPHVNVLELNLSLDALKRG